MTTLTIRNFRNSMAASLDKVDAGERIVVRRRNRSYAIVQADEEVPVITPQLMKKIETARQEHREGKTLRFNNAAEAQKWMDEL